MWCAKKQSSTAETYSLQYHPFFSIEVQEVDGVIEERSLCSSVRENEVVKSFPSEDREGRREKGVCNKGRRWSMMLTNRHGKGESNGGTGIIV